MNVLQFKTQADLVTLEDVQNLRTAKADKTVQTHLERLKRGVFAKNEINALKGLITKSRWAKEERKQSVKALVNLSMDYQDTVYVPGYTGQAFAEVHHFKKPMRITKEQTTFGKAWLKDWFFKKNGDARSGKRTEDVGTRVLSIAKSVARFEFIGFVMVKSFNDQETPFHILPIYRTYNRKGEYFDYAPMMWAAPIIMEGF